MSEKQMTEQATLNLFPPAAKGNGSIAYGESVGVDIDAELVAWLHEALRLFGEAEIRLRSGEVLPALSSLAAVPPLHGMLMGRCSEMLEPTKNDLSDAPNGIYL
ncbi:MAG: hypothetical protein HOE14_17440 [Gemmatimonadales bacterium]|nr:hypothetical protein [Gemmatimonadales bacterium]MBT4188980.1 hypothetical protein [Gemmatimonadales bacterium]MBT7692404.1 hypothetical protein [Gemmatimonadales bacterium]